MPQSHPSDPGIPGPSNKSVESLRSRLPEDIQSLKPPLRLIFWELTSACNLHCVHCRAVPAERRSPDELAFDEASVFLRELSSFAKPVVVISGGEPLIRPDIFRIASLASSLGLAVALATNATLVTPDTAREIKKSGIRRVSVSFDGATSETHDNFRRVPGAFEKAWCGVEYLKQEGIPFQVNTTISKHNVDELAAILDMAITRGAVALHVFLLVPAGCAKDIPASEMLSAVDYERVLGWVYERSKDSPIPIKPTCAPHYFRIVHQRARKEGFERVTETHSLDAVTKGCLAGTSVCFISSKGEVYPCGYLPVSAGNIRKRDFKQIWEKAEVFRLLRDEENLKGKCGCCEFRRVCMGCRARAYGMTGDFLAGEPFCSYKPKRKTTSRPDV